MKKFLLVLACSLVAVKAATLSQMRTRVDDWLAARWDTVTNRQATYFSNHNGRYWQGLITHSNIPSHTTGQTNDTTGDKLTQHPTDVAESWHGFMNELDAVPFPCAIVCDNYGGPRGSGYIVSVYVTFNGVTYSRSQNVGGETERNEAWHIVTITNSP